MPEGMPNKSEWEKSIESWEAGSKDAEQLFTGLNIGEPIKENIAPEEGEKFEVSEAEKKEAELMLDNMIWKLLNHPALRSDKLKDDPLLKDLNERLATLRNFSTKYFRGIRLKPEVFSGKDLSLEQLTSGGNLKEQKS